MGIYDAQKHLEDIVLVFPKHFYFQNAKKHFRAVFVILKMFQAVS